MNESNKFLSNWEFKDIKFKELIDLDFPLPQYRIEINSKVYKDVSLFNENGTKAFTFEYFEKRATGKAPSYIR